jgi:glycosyltransferase involved in cell wall biosynthesis
MRITWLISSAVSLVDGPTDKPASLSVPLSATRWYSPLASLRYRVLSPARYLQEEGHQNQFLRLDQQPDRDEIIRALRADVVVVSKVLARGSVELAQQAKQLGARVVVDLCDDHFDTAELGPAYQTLCRTADRVVASTAAMAQVIARRTGVQPTIIDDPYEGPPGRPRFEPSNNAAKLLWFGHPVNFDTLADMVPRLGALARRRPLSLHVVSDPSNNGIRAFVEQVNRQHGPGLTARFTVWSPEATWQALADCDLVVVPSLPAAKKLVKSPNRVVEPLRAGRFVVAYPLPSYIELAGFLCLEENVAAGVEWALANAAEVRHRIEAGQAYVHRRFDPQVIARVWEAVLLQTVEYYHQAA